MSIFSYAWGAIRGGWKTHGPNAISGAGAFDDTGSPFEAVTSETAMRLSALRACLSLRAETIGTMPLHLRDAKKNKLTTHPLYDVLHRSPNADMTAAEFWSLATAHVDMHGNFVCVIERRSDKSVIALTPANLASCKVEYSKNGKRKIWTIGADEHSDDDILHLRGFTMCGDWGEPLLDFGRQILSAQLQANTSAMMAFKQGLKVGGFFLNEGKHELTAEQAKEFAGRLDYFGRSENAGRWMTLLRGFKPIAGTEFSVKPAEAQLLESRYFGIEEICRLANVPPPLIGHTSKTSTWPSSLENLNLHLMVYSLSPTVKRYEQRIEKKLLTPYDRAAGVEAKFSMQALLRGDTKARQSFYLTGLQNGYLSQNEVRDFEEMPGIGPEGDVYRVQLNMAGSDAAGNNDPDPNQDNAK